MKIAVIDDGINKVISEDGLHINCHYHYVNSMPEGGIRHGTKVIGTVEKYCSGVKEYEVYDVMNTKEASCSMAVTAALEDLLCHRADIILMCLVVQNDNVFERIKELCHELRKRGSIIIASTSNSRDFSIPAELDDVIGVGRLVNCQYAVCWNGKKNIQLLGDITPEFIKIGKNQRTVFSGTSKAAARIAAMVLKECNKGMKSSEQMLEIFKESLPHNVCNMVEQIERREYEVNLQNKQIYRIIYDTLKRMGYHLADDGRDCYFDRFVHDIDEFAWLVSEIINKFDVPIIPERMHYFDFMSVYALANYLGKYV